MYVLSAITYVLVTCADSIEMLGNINAHFLGFLGGATQQKYFHPLVLTHAREWECGAGGCARRKLEAVPVGGRGAECVRRRGGYDAREQRRFVPCSNNLVRTEDDRKRRRDCSVQAVRYTVYRCEVRLDIGGGNAEWPQVAPGRSKLIRDYSVSGPVRSPVLRDWGP